MPNWVTNIITMENVDEKMITTIKKFVKGKRKELKDGKEIEEEIVFDFNKITAMPEKLEKTTSPSLPPNKKEFKNAFKYAEACIKWEKTSKSLIKEYGFNNWYDWRSANWGTKWNTESSIEFKNGFEFDTAWSCPLPALETLSKKFPTVSFKIEYADEDMGVNCGEFTLVNGEIVEELIYEYDEESKRFACKVKGMDYEDYLREQEEEE